MITAPDDSSNVDRKQGEAVSSAADTTRGISNSQSVVTTPATSSRPHLGYIDGLRGVAALYVVFYHCHGDTVGSRGIPVGLAKMVAMPLGFGHQTVDLFIVLSGFCLMLPALKNGYRLRDSFSHFLYKRARRILPPYYAALALSLVGVTSSPAILTAAPFWMQKLTVFGMLAHLFLLQDLFENTLSQINQVFWSISVEWRIYLALPVLLYLWRRYGPPAALVASVVTVIASFTILPLLGMATITEDSRGSMPHYLILFTFGLIASDVAYGTSTFLAKLRNTAFPLGMITIALSVVSIVSTRLPLEKATTIIAISDVIVGLWAAVLLVYLAKHPTSWLSRLLSRRTITWCGSFAYSIYLTHLIILRIIEVFVFRNLNVGYLPTLGILILLAIPLVIALAYVFFLLFERPFLSTTAKKAAA